MIKPKTIQNKINGKNLAPKKDFALWVDEQRIMKSKKNLMNFNHFKYTAEEDDKTISPFVSGDSVINFFF